MAGDAAKDIGEPSLRIDVIHLGGDDKAVHGGGALTAAIGAGKEPRLPAEGNAAKAAFGSVVREAHASVVKEAREGRPALEHIVHGLGDIASTRELGSRLPHPGFEIRDQWCAQFLADSLALFRGVPIDSALDLEQGIDAPDGLQSQWRDRGRRLAFGLAAGTRLDVGEREERSARMGPAGRFQDRSGLAASFVEPVVSRIGVRLQQAGPAGEMRLDMRAAAIARVVEHRRRRCSSSKRAIVARVNPAASGHGLALGKHRHGRIVPVQPFGGEDMRLDATQDGLQHSAGGADLVGERRQAQGHTFACIAFGLPVQRLVLPELLEQQHGEQVGASPPARDDVERRRRLADPLAVPARHLLAHVLNHLPLAWDHLQRLGDRLAQLA
jgi:hypothetical protein